MFLSDLQRKTLINIVDGKEIGEIVDVKVEPSSGKLLGLIISNKKGVFNMIGGKEDLEVLWDKIVKIGEDVILVKITY